jgi:protease I
MSKQLNGRHIAVLATDGFEQSELQEPKRLLEEAGAIVHVIAPDGAKQIKGWDKKDWGSAVNVDKSLDQANVNDYDALVLPGGVINPDKLRLDAKAIALIKAFGAADKPIAAICHGPWTLINAELVDGRKITSWPSTSSAWQDSEVVQDGNLITSRKPDDIPAFTKTLIEAIAA